ncbi:hypothetical protein R3X27_13615 [Tropicimonas sp. TH_r6]|uniref:hypothetical protein n=1 Tax=Tropicimonas sp. TH_r6 TaxID=3082085 RepID=UPI002954C3EC|nr:hypothetical protein [Tropicimonas sp. TH_r6]MDV7143719.1 hypothetical protein [Tropicimonas sp. TH_r6]
MKPAVARFLPKAVGLIFIALAIWFLARTVVENRQALADWRPDIRDIALMAGLGVFYALSLLLLAETWHRIVNLFGTEPRKRTFQSYTATLVARYIPGNIAHLIGRAAYLRNGSLGTGDLGRATLLELAITPLGAVLALALLWVKLPKEDLPVDLSALPWPVPLLVCAAGLFSLRLFARQARIAKVLLPVFFSALFMIGLGTSFALLAASETTVALPVAAAIAICAWIAGYVTPGAPGGVGTREAVLVALMSAAGCPADMAIVLSVQLRLVTLTGEVLCTALGWLAWPFLPGQAGKSGCPETSPCQVSTNPSPQPPPSVEHGK